MVSNRTLVFIVGWGGVIVSSTGYYLKNKLIDKVCNMDYYKESLKILRQHAGAVYYLGEPIKDGRIKLTDTENNYSDQVTARFCIPVYGPKDKGRYYFSAENKEGKWNITKAELELKSNTQGKLMIVKENNV